MCYYLNVQFQGQMVNVYNTSHIIHTVIRMAIVRDFLAELIT